MFIFKIRIYYYLKDIIKTEKKMEKELNFIKIKRKNLKGNI